MEKKAKELNEKGIALYDETKKAIMEMMKEENVSLISFTRNGESRDMDVDHSYACVEVNGLIEQNEIIAVAIMDNNLVILVDNPYIMTETYHTLDVHTFYSYNSAVEEIFEEEEFIDIHETLTPTDTILQLVYSVEEMLKLTEQEGIYDEELDMNI